MKASPILTLLLLGGLLLSCEPGATENTLPSVTPKEDPQKPDGPVALSVTVTTGAASDLSAHSATLNATSAGANATIRETGFEWGTTEQLGQVVQGYGTTSFTAPLEDLEPETTYWYRAYVTLQREDEIKDFYGEVRSFTTLAHEAPSSNVPVWAELPVMNVKEQNSYLVSTTDQQLYFAWHYCPDVQGPGGRQARNYTVCFSAEHHCPVWVAAPRHSMYNGKEKRSEAYKADPDIPSDIQYIKKAADSGCNNGHMLGSEERTCTKATNEQVFYFSNIAPQLSSGFNTGGGGWNLLEDFVDGQVCSDTLYLVIGCYFKDYTDGYGKSAKAGKITFGNRSDVSFPTMFYYLLMRTKNGNSGKRVEDCSASELQCAAFVRAHTNDLKGQKVTSRDMMSVEDLEKITGFTYFPNVPNAPKSTFSASDWGL